MGLGSVAWFTRWSAAPRRPPRAIVPARAPLAGLGFDEPRFRRFVADHLGIDAALLVPNVSLRDELAVDSLDLVDLTLALEAHFGIVWPDHALERVRSYGDLVRATRARIATTTITRLPDAAAPAIVEPMAVAIGWEGHHG